MREIRRKIRFLQNFIIHENEKRGILFRVENVIISTFFWGSYLNYEGLKHISFYQISQLPISSYLNYEGLKLLWDRL